MKAGVAKFYWHNLSGASIVLDVGCGDGTLGAFAPPGVKVYGLERNEARVREAMSFEDVTQCDLDTLTQLPFPDGTFDGVVAKDILEHLNKPWDLLRELRRVLRPGGVLVVSVICERGHRLWADYTHVRGFTRQSLRNLLSDSGFEVDEVWRMGGVPLSSRLNLISQVPLLLRIPPLDWIYTSSYEARAFRPKDT